MKKTLLALIAFVGILSSCTNDDIIVSRVITFKINPATVVENLYERNAGDLTSLTSGAKLHVTLYIYDEKGILVSQANNEYSAYTHMMTTDIDLPAGNYTAVAATHVTSSVNFWTFSGVDQLSTFKIKDNGYVGGKSKILGLTIKKFNIGDYSETISINVENAGVVSFVQFYKWNKYSDVKEYSLMGKQSCDYASFDNLGNIDYSIKSESTYKFYKILYDYDSSYQGASGYFFSFPIKNASFRFYALTKSNERIAMGVELVDDIKKGHSYWMLYDFDNDDASWYDVTPESSRSIDLNNDLYKLENSENERIDYDYEDHSITIQ